MDADPPKSTLVAAALIPSGGRIFIAQRPPQKKFGLLWEFPGGKVETGESVQLCLVREIREELCWQIEVGKLFQDIRYEFQDFNIHLYAYWCTVLGGNLCLREHVACYWAHPAELWRFPFTTADQQLVVSLEQLPSFPEEAEFGDTTSSPLCPR